MEPNIPQDSKIEFFKNGEWRRDPVKWQEHGYKNALDYCEHEVERTGEPHRIVMEGEEVATITIQITPPKIH